MDEIEPMEVDVVEEPEEDRKIYISGLNFQKNLTTLDNTSCESHFAKYGIAKYAIVECFVQKNQETKR